MVLCWKGKEWFDRWMLDYETSKRDPFRHRKSEGKVYLFAIASTWNDDHVCYQFWGSYWESSKLGKTSMWLGLALKRDGRRHIIRRKRGRIGLRIDCKGGWFAEKKMNKGRGIIKDHQKSFAIQFIIESFLLLSLQLIDGNLILASQFHADVDRLRINKWIFWGVSNYLRVSLSVCVPLKFYSVSTNHWMATRFLKIGKLQGSKARFLVSYLLKYKHEAITQDPTKNGHRNR